ncbi:CST complex subunit STN1-like [Mizuhopecten yessoensis]|uniref:CST complex subunit STN1 n=1 Tax=Mizuhopecten yessoensis TaxID=6573 RepID=A0A210Q9E5_MIZYE|nr:CST complex subunit STN1-like [Mizuhopecten yessoensis]XP_021363942.1 CST complex subunit STN1-like [Mizuhopecten yessoensis]OWF45367.1 CST complex subunit STN1 [Mizuhopecten yessoensis]
MMSNKRMFDGQGSMSNKMTSRPVEEETRTTRDVCNIYVSGTTEMFGHPPNETSNSMSEGLHPTKTWGLDYYFMIFNKMYIADVLQMRENTMFPGTYLYRSHPLFKVDVMGVVVKVEQNHTCFTYTVDDGTGVIPCCCWRKEFFNMSDPGCDWSGLPTDLRGLAAGIADHKTHEGYVLGDLIQVRGKVKMFRDQREVVATYHTRLDDPMEEVLRLAELPKIYRKNYDQPFQLPHKVAREIDCNRRETVTGVLSKESLVLQAKNTMTDYFLENQIREITPDSLLREIDSKLLSAGEQKKQCVQDALTRLENAGLVCVRREKQRYVLEVLTHPSALQKTLYDILDKQCSKSKHADVGCHFLHLHQEVCRTFQYAKVKINAVRTCLTRLEEHSDVIRTTVDRYRTVPS